MAAHVKPVWTPAPAAQQIDAAARDRLVADLQESEEPDGAAAALADRLLDGGKLPARAQLLSRLLSREMARLPKGESLKPVAIPGTGQRSPPRRRRSARFSRPPAVPPSCSA